MSGDNMSTGNGTSSSGTVNGGSSPGKSSSAVAFVGMALFIGLGLFFVIYYTIRAIIKKLQEPLQSPVMAPDVVNNTNQSWNLGLDLKDISLLPTFPYQTANWRCRNQKHEHRHQFTTAECAVCLSELEEGEMVRVLPACKHYFHVNCIDMWLSANSSCPMCRAHPEPEKLRTGMVAISPPWHPLIRSGSSDMRQLSLGSCLSSPFVKTPRKSPILIGASPFHVSWQGSPSVWIATPPRNLQEILV